MKAFLNSIACLMLGCVHGAWLPVDHREPLVQAYLRQCRRCRKFEHRGYVIHKTEDAPEHRGAR